MTRNSRGVCCRGDRGSKGRLFSSPGRTNSQVPTFLEPLKIKGAMVDKDVGQFVSTFPKAKETLETANER